MNTEKTSFVLSKLVIVAVAVSSFLAITAPSSKAAYTWKDFQFGGFASQGYLNSSANDYLGDTSGGTFEFREYAFNTSWSKGEWRIGAQAFAQRLGEYGKDRVKLDWAMVDYQPRQWLGFRAGRVKMPRGLYNESLDLDSVRPFVLLPQSVYDNRLRDFSSAFNGAMAYGNVELGKAGSLDYRVFYGKMPMSLASGASDYFNTDAPFPNISIKLNSAHGGSLFWNTPIMGLKTGYSYSDFRDFQTSRYVPFRAAVSTKNAKSYKRHLFSAEYTWKDWVFAAETGWERVHYDVTYPNLPQSIWLFSESRYRYLSIARRINTWLELGTYYSYSDFEQLGIGTSVQMPLQRQSDYALSARFDLNEHVIFKIEGHYMDGAQKIFDIPSHPQPVSVTDKSWTMVAAKITVSF